MKQTPGIYYLKRALPLPNVDISKLEIMTLAIKWIDHLETMLENYDDQRELLTIRQMETSTQQNRDSYFKKKNTCFKQKIA